jgi:hypothetical protein
MRTIESLPKEANNNCRSAALISATPPPDTAKLGGNLDPLQFVTS